MGPMAVAQVNQCVSHVVVLAVFLFFVHQVVGWISKVPEGITCDTIRVEPWIQIYPGEHLLLVLVLVVCGIVGDTLILVKKLISMPCV